MALMAVAGIAAVSAIAQLYNGEKARGANKKELDRIKAIWDKMVPPDLNISPNDPPQYVEQALQGAKLDFSRITPEEFKVVGQFSPEAAQYISEVNPKLVQNTAEGKEGRQAQIDALRQFQQISQGKDPRFQAMMDDAARQSQTQAQSRMESTLQDSQRRGGLNSGQAFGAMLQGNSDAMQMGAANSRAAAIEAYQNKLQALQTSGTMGRNLAQDELSQEQTNAGIINDFNQRTTKAYQSYLQQQAELRNQAQLYNLQAQQGASDKNTMLRNDTNRFNLQNQNQLAQQQYGNQRDERNYQNQLAAAKAQWGASEKDRYNQLQQQQFNNQAQIAAGKSGQAQQSMAYNNQAAADRNAAISGLSQAGIGAFMNQYQADREDARWDKYGKSQNPNYLSQEELQSFGKYK